MKKITLLAITGALLLSSQAYARDDIGNYSLNEALTTVKAKQILGDDVSFYFGDQKHGKVEKSMGIFSTNKKTNAFGKSDQEACNWAFLGAMKTLRERAIREGGNAVIEIKSNYKNNLTSSEETFQCGAGAVIAGVALTGKVVTLSK